MILSLTRNTTRLALRVKDVVQGWQLYDWRDLRLIIAPGQLNREDGGGCCWDNCCDCCDPMGSPWYLSGCWPFHPTGVDVANPSRYFDFPSIILDAFETDDEGRIVFLLDKRVHSLPNGRYTGILQRHAHALPINVPATDSVASNQHPLPAPLSLGAMIHYEPQGTMAPCNQTVTFDPPRQDACILAMFDIDLGPECAQHMVDQMAVEFRRDDCGEVR